jgi:hypothetical protein
MLTAENPTEILKKGAISSGRQRDREHAKPRWDRRLQLFEMLKRMSLVKPVELMVFLGDCENGQRHQHSFQGDGWKLSGIQLPSAAVQVLAQNLINKRSGW